MKIARHFAAAVLVVAVVVLIGLAWKRFAPILPSEIPAGPEFAVHGHTGKGLPHGGGPPPGAGQAPAGVREIMRTNGSGIPVLAGDLLKPVNLVVLRNNAFIGAAVITAVVIADASYRKLRRARRAKT